MFAQVLLRQEHHDESARETVRLQVRLSRADDGVPSEPVAADAAAAAAAAAAGHGPVVVRVRVRRVVLVRLWRGPVRATARVRGRRRGDQPAAAAVGRHISDRAVLLGHFCRRRRRPVHPVPTPGRRPAVSALKAAGGCTLFAPSDFVQIQRLPGRRVQQNTVSKTCDPSSSVLRLFVFFPLSTG